MVLSLRSSLCSALRRAGDAPPLTGSSSGRSPAFFGATKRHDVLRGQSPGRRNALRALQVAAENAALVAKGQEPVGLHDLRHSLAANSFALGLSDVEARLLRPANPRVTMTVYACLVDGEASKLGEKLTAGGFGS